MTESNADLIAEARAWGIPQIVAAPMVTAQMIVALAAALDAVQPVLAVGDYSPDRDAVAKAIFEYDNSAAPSLTFNPEQHVEYLHMADALLASGVLGQPSSDVQTGSKFEVPQPQPNREAGARIIGEHEEVYDENLDRMVCSCGDDYTEGLMREHIFDALLPLLGQPQPDEDFAEKVIAKLRDRFIVNPEGGPYVLHFNQAEIEDTIRGAVADVEGDR